MKIETLLTEEERENPFLLQGYYDCDNLFEYKNLNNTSYLSIPLLLCITTLDYEIDDLMDYLKGAAIRYSYGSEILTQVRDNYKIVKFINYYKNAMVVSKEYNGDMKPLIDKALVNSIAKDNLIEVTPNFKRNVPFKAGDSVVDIARNIDGIGTVAVVIVNENYPILVKFNDYLLSYDLEGKYEKDDIHPRLFLVNENPRLVITSQKDIRQYNE